ncbi:HNH endonuclease [Mycolicibacterium conceptionense]|uniref:HNH endonuclease n=1 Tax=Mycolicibacterium conceptionense TaxID=451644 RepID=A0A0U1D4U0_9MYCO|nr:HNH endonuclease signature motif containing protein [Mycolicibacterium conceptionense]ORV20951.1 hypothetical protein AWB98_01235 [Mycolicibacterium conceptionense]CQD07199.1 HNH endonuclease [Mycolicibacterium conceptionense]
MAWQNGGAGSKIPAKVKRTVRHRQRNQCAVYDITVCTGQIDAIDHVINVKTLGLPRAETNTDLENLQGLCLPCHKKKTSAEAHAAKRAKRFRKPPIHPGLYIPTKE